MREKRWSRPLLYVGAAVLASLTSVGLFAVGQWFTGKNSLENVAIAESKGKQLPEGGLSQLRQTSESFRVVAKRVGPAVVNIKATRGSKKRPPAGRGRRQAPQHEEDGGPFGGRDPFFDFFERFGQPFPMPQESPQAASMGSGIIIDSKGHVVTNNHVVEGASEILVTLSNDKTDLKAKIVGTDAKTDLAVLQILNANNLPVAEWADSDAVEVGDWAVAIGSPFMLSQSVTVGIISAKGRNASALMGADYGFEMLQTDAAINPGNSGGPLCTIEGKVVGVNSAIYTRSGGYMGIGFAIPSNLARDVVEKLLKFGKITRGWLGVMIQPLGDALAKELKVKAGVGVHEVIEGSPAAQAGVQAGDVVTGVNGKPVSEVSQLQRIISGFKPGEKVSISVVSSDSKKERTVTVKIGELPDNDEAAQAAAGGGATGEPDRLGIIVSKNKGGGVKVEAIQPGSPAEMGLEPGDVIVEVKGKAVNSVEDYRKATRSGSQLYLKVKRKGRTLFFQLTLPE